MADNKDDWVDIPIDQDQGTDDWVDITEPIESEESGAMKAAVRGAGDSALFGFGDEVVAGASAGLRALGIDIPASNKFEDIQLKSPTLDVGSKYDEILKAYRQSTEQLEEENPIAAGAGTLAGALMPGGLAAGAIKGAGKLGGRAVGGAALGKGLGKKATEAAIKSGRILGTGAAMAGTGAGAGALYGFGSGEGVEDRLEEAVPGAKLGAGLGVAAPLGIKAGGKVVEGLGSVIKSIGEMKPVQRAREIFKRSWKGEKFSGDEQLDNVASEINDYLVKAEQQFGKQLKTEKATRQEAVDTATEQGTLINFKDKLANLRQRYNELPEGTEQEIADKRDLLRIVDEYELGLNVAEEKLVQKSQVARDKAADTLAGRAALREVKEGKPFGAEEVVPTSEGKDVLQRFQELTTEQMEQGVKPKSIEKVLPDEYSYTPQPKTEMSPQETLDFVKRMEEMTQMGQTPLRTEIGQKAALEGKRTATEAVGDVVPEFGPQTQKISDILSNFKRLSKRDKGDLNPTIDDYLGGIREVIQKSTDEASLRVKLNEIMSKGWVDPRTGREMLPMAQINPEMAQKMTNEFTELAQKHDLTTAANMVLENTGSLSRLGGGIQGFGLRGVELAGRAAGKVEKAVKAPYEYGKDLMKLTPQGFQDLAGHIAQKGGATANELSKRLYEASSKDNRQRQAMIFAILQNPNYRKMLKGDESDESR